MLTPGSLQRLCYSIQLHGDKVRARVSYPETLRITVNLWDIGPKSSWQYGRYDYKLDCLLLSLKVRMFTGLESTSITDNTMRTVDSYSQSRSKCYAKIVLLSGWYKTLKTMWLCLGKTEYNLWFLCLILRGTGSWNELLKKLLLFQYVGLDNTLTPCS